MIQDANHAGALCTLFTIFLSCSAWAFDSDHDGVSDGVEIAQIPQLNPNDATDVLNDTNANGFSAWAERLYAASSHPPTSIFAGADVWKHTFGDKILAAPVRDTDGTLYVSTRDRKVSAVNSDGTLLWSYDTEGYVHHSVAITPTGEVVVVDGKTRLRLLSSTGQSIWVHDTDDNIMAAPVVSSDGTIYIVTRDRFMIAIDENGTEKWRIESDTYFYNAPAVDADGSVYMVSRRKLFRISSEGDYIWYAEFGSDISASPVIAGIGTVYIALTERELKAISSFSEELWSFETENKLRSRPAIGPDGNIFVGDGGGRVYSISPQGTENWHVDLNDEIDAGPVVGSDGNIFVPAISRTLYSINSTGSIRWTFEADSFLRQTPTLSKTGIVYVSDEQSNLYAIADNSIGHAPWGMARGNIRGNGHQCWSPFGFQSVEIDSDNDGINDCQEFLDGIMDLPQAPTGTPSGSITPNSSNPDPTVCYIPAGENTCSVDITWTTTNLVIGRLWTFNGSNWGWIDEGTSDTVTFAGVTDQGTTFEVHNGFSHAEVPIASASALGASASLDATPTQCEIPYGSSTCTVTVSWTSRNLSNASLWRSDDGGQNWQLVTQGASGSAIVTTNQVGTLLEVHPLSTRSVTMASANVSGYRSPRGTISPSTSLCVVPTGATNCANSFTVTWTAENVSSGSLWQKDGSVWTQLGTGVGGNSTITLLTTDETLFSVFPTETRSGNAVATAIVRKGTGSLSLAPTHCDIALGETTCPATISWWTDNLLNVSVWQSNSTGWSKISTLTSGFQTIQVGAPGSTVELRHGQSQSGTLLDTTSISATIPADTDGDTIANGSDNCPGIANLNQLDTDADGLGDACDGDDDNDNWSDADELACGTNPLSNTSTPVDANANGRCDALDTSNPDADLDGVEDANDDFPFDNTETTDTDSDGIGNNADLDDDNDGTPDDADGYPTYASLYDDGITSSRPGTSTASSIITANSVGPQPYDAGVSVDGLAQILIPITVLPGVNGLQPSLAISYDSGRMASRAENHYSQGVLGYGWALDGLSSIRRCEPLTNATTAPAGIALDASDQLCLDGNHLVQVTGTGYWDTNSTYRLRRDDFSLITKLASGFKVETYDGLILTYGVTPDAIVAAGGTSVDFVWALSKVEDRFGNVMTYSYHEDAANGEFYPDEINYDGAKVSFEYAARSTKATTKVGIGSGYSKSSVYLHKILVAMNGTNVREYRLESPQTGNRNRLGKVQECGWDEAGTVRSCLDPMSFTWTTTTTHLGVTQVTDTLGAVTNFNLAAELPTISGAPFGQSDCNYQASYLDANPFNFSRRLYATQMTRDDGISNGTGNVFNYAARCEPKFRTDNGGYAGHEVIRVTNVERGTVQYLQRHTAFPFTGGIVASKTFIGTDLNGEPTSATESEWTSRTFDETGTEFVYRKRGVVANYEGGQVFGASETAVTYTFDPSHHVPSAMVTTESTGESLTDGRVENNLRSVKGELTFDVNSSEWIHGFIDSARSTHTGEDGTDQEQLATFTRYGSTLRPATITETRGTAADLTTTLTYDAKGNTGTITQNAADITSRTTTLASYASNRYPQTVTNGEAETESLVYDLRFGTPKQITRADGLTTIIDHDPFGRVITLDEPSGRQVDISYVEATVDPFNGHPRKYYVYVNDSAQPNRWFHFDHLNRLIRRQTQAFASGTYVFDDLGYDTLGRQTTQSLPGIGSAGADIVMAYDLRDRLTSRSEPDGGSATVNYALEGDRLRVTQTKSILVPGASAVTEVHSTTLDALGQVRTSTDPEGSEIHYGYDGLGNLIKSEIAGNVTSMVFDPVGNRISISEPNTGTTTFTYDALGLLRTQLDAANRQTNFTYDRVDRLIERIDEMGAANENTNVWKFGTTGINTGKLICESNHGGDCGLTDGEFRRDYTYDPQTGKNKSTTTSIDADIDAVLSQQWIYDSVGRVSQVIYPDGYSITNQYSSTGYLDQVIDVNNTVLRDITAINAFGKVTSEALGNGTSTTRTFDADSGRLTGITTMLGATSIQQNIYDWRSDGLLAERTSGALSENFVYDSLKRLTQAHTPSTMRQLDYQYDALGNLKSKTSTKAKDISVTGYLYENTPNAVSSLIIGGARHTLSYDAVGNVLSIDPSDGEVPSRTFEYDGRNLASKIMVKDTTGSPIVTEEFRYDPNGKRYFKKAAWDDEASYTGGQWTSYTVYAGALERYWMVGDMAAEYTDNLSVAGVVKRKRTKLLISSDEIELFYLHFDHLGSIERITTQEGEVENEQSFDPFGGRRNSTWTLGISPYIIGDDGRLGFTGHEQLDRTGIIHMNGRIYDPAIGRFLNADPLVNDPLATQSYNLYSYVRNSPMSFVDPSGYADASLDDNGACGPEDERGRCSEDYYWPNYWPRTVFPDDNRPPLWQLIPGPIPFFDVVPISLKEGHAITQNRAETTSKYLLAQNNDYSGSTRNTKNYWSCGGRCKSGQAHETHEKLIGVPFKLILEPWQQYVAIGDLVAAEIGKFPHPLAKAVAVLIDESDIGSIQHRNVAKGHLNPVISTEYDSLYEQNRGGNGGLVEIPIYRTNPRIYKTGLKPIGEVYIVNEGRFCLLGSPHRICTK